MSANRRLPPRLPLPRPPGARDGLLEEIGRLDRAIYDAVARTQSPALDRALGALSRAADYSRLLGR